MAKITLQKLAKTLMQVRSGEGKVELSGSVVADAQKALDAMLRI